MHLGYDNDMLSSVFGYELRVGLSYERERAVLTEPSCPCCDLYGRTSTMVKIKNSMDK